MGGFLKFNISKIFVVFSILYVFEEIPSFTHTSGTHEYIKKVLDNPPSNFFSMKSLIPFYVYDKDREGDYVIFLQCKGLDYDAINHVGLESATLMSKYISFLLLDYIDPRPDAKFRIVFDLNGLSIKDAISGKGRHALSAILNGFYEAVEYTGIRTKVISVINRPRFSSPFISLLKTMLYEGIELESYAGESEWGPALRKVICPKNMPREYGGENRIPLAESEAEIMMRQYVTARLQRGKQ